MQPAQAEGCDWNSGYLLQYRRNPAKAQSDLKQQPYDESSIGNLKPWPWRRLSQRRQP